MLMCDLGTWLCNMPNTGTFVLGLIVLLGGAWLWFWTAWRIWRGMFKKISGEVKTWTNEQ